MQYTCMSRLLNVCPVFRDAATNAAFRNVKAIRTIPSAGARNEGLHLHRHGGNLRCRPGDRDGSHQGRRGVPAESTPDDPRRERGNRRMSQGRRHGSLDRGLPLEFRQPHPGRAARGGDAPSRNSTRVLHDARPRWVLRRRIVRRISCKGGNTAGDPRSHVQRNDRRRASERHGGGRDRDQRVPRGPPWSPGGPRNGRLGRDRRGEGIESERAHGRGEGRDGGHVREESAPQEGPGTDSGRGHQGGPGGEDDPAPSSKDPRPTGC